MKLYVIIFGFCVLLLGCQQTSKKVGAPAEVVEASQTTAYVDLQKQNTSGALYVYS